MFTLQQLLDAGLPATSTDGNDKLAVTDFSRELTAQEWNTYLTIANPREAAYQIDKQQLKGAYQTMITRLEQIQNAGTIPFTSAGFAQVVQAVKDEALYIEKLMQFIRTLLE